MYAAVRDVNAGTMAVQNENARCNHWQQGSCLHASCASCCDSALCSQCQSMLRSKPSRAGAPWVKRGFTQALVGPPFRAPRPPELPVYQFLVQPPKLLLPFHTSSQ